MCIEHEFSSHLPVIEKRRILCFQFHTSKHFIASFNWLFGPCSPKTIHLYSKGILFLFVDYCLLLYFVCTSSNTAGDMSRLMMSQQHRLKCKHKIKGRVYQLDLTVSNRLLESTVRARGKSAPASISSCRCCFWFKIIHFQPTTDKLIWIPYRLSHIVRCFFFLEREARLRPASPE